MIADRAGQLLAALLVEAAMGYPAWLFSAIGHPVSWIGALIAGLDRAWNHGAGWRRRALGAMLLLVITGVAAGAGWAITVAADVKRMSYAHK